MLSPQQISHINIEFLSENALLLSWPDIICVKQHQAIIHLEKVIRHDFSHLITESITSYNSLILYYNFEEIRNTRLIKRLRLLIENITINIEQNTSTQFSHEESKTINIPVYYGVNAGWDLEQIAQEKQRSIEEIIQLHSAHSYRSYALGFTPGFCYLASSSEELMMPRRATPRTVVPKGAVAIAELQTAIYPNESPGGWHIIGQTPLAMFNVQDGEFTPTIAVGDTVTFTPIDKKTFFALGGTLATE